MIVRTVEEAAQAVVGGLDPPVRYGEVVLRIVDGRVTLLRYGFTLKPEDLAALLLDEE